MKKNKKKSQKSLRRAARKDITSGLINQLNNTFSKLGKPSKKLTKTIQKESKKLAKKLSNKLKINKSSLQTTQSLTTPPEIMQTPSIIKDQKSVKRATTRSAAPRSRPQTSKLVSKPAVSLSRVKKTPVRRPTVKTEKV